MRLMPLIRPSLPPAAAPRYIWQQPGWPALTVDAARLASSVQTAQRQLGQVLGQAAALGLMSREGLHQQVWVDEAIATAAIEGERLNRDSVRSSVLRRLGLTDDGPSSRDVEGLIDVLQDAVAGHAAVLDVDRLCRWQSALFPAGTSGIHRIAVGRYRDHTEAMQIISGQLGREVVHYTAPPSSTVAAEMERFLAWFESTRPTPRQPIDIAMNGSSDGPIDGITRAALAHLWFESIHPFEDGNGRIGRAIVELALAQDRGAASRMVSLSTQLLAHRRAYYDALHTAQTGGLDVTAWVQWFAQTFTQACEASCTIMASALQKASFWSDHTDGAVNARQRKVLQKLLDAGDGGFLGGLTAEKYTKITGASKATATRDLADLLRQELLWVQGVGKATRYGVKVVGWVQGVS